MRGAELVRRYYDTTGWNESSLLDLIIGLLDGGGMLDEVVANLDAIAEEEMDATFEDEEY